MASSTFYGEGSNLYVRTGNEMWESLDWNLFVLPISLSLGLNLIQIFYDRSR